MRPMYVSNMVVTRQADSLIFTFENDNRQTAVRMSIWRAGKMQDELKIIAPELFPEEKSE